MSKGNMPDEIWAFQNDYEGNGWHDNDNLLKNWGCPKREYIAKSESVSNKDIQAEIKYWEGVRDRCYAMPDYTGEADYAEMIIYRLQALIKKEGKK